MLGLIGISAATGLGAVVVDATKRADTSNQRRSLETEQVSLQTRITQLKQAVAANPAPANRDDLQKELAEKKGRLADVEATLAKLPPPERPKSEGFLRDIMQENTGVSFHRFQIFVWTIVLGLIFVFSVYKDLTMPDFNATLLGLMGISAGTYLGFKFPGAQQ